MTNLYFANLKLIITSSLISFVVIYFQLAYKQYMQDNKIQTEV